MQDEQPIDISTIDDDLAHLQKLIERLRGGHVCDDTGRVIGDHEGLIGDLQQVFNLMESKVNVAEALYSHESVLGAVYSDLLDGLTVVRQGGELMQNSLEAIFDGLDRAADYEQELQMRADKEKEREQEFEDIRQEIRGLIQDQATADRVADLVKERIDGSLTFKGLSF